MRRGRSPTRRGPSPIRFDADHDVETDRRYMRGKSMLRGTVNQVIPRSRSVSLASVRADDAGGGGSKKFLYLDPLSIKPTQKWINDKFPGNKKDKRPEKMLLDVAYELYMKDLGVDDFPTITVARHPKLDENPYHCRDNRRLFLFKVLMIPSIKCEVLAWMPKFKFLMENFDNLVVNKKILTNDEIVEQFRNQFIEHLKMKADNRGNLVFVPRNMVGFIVGRKQQTKFRMQSQYKVKIQIIKHKFESGGAFPVIPIGVEPRGERADAKNVSRCINNVKKMVNKLCDRNNVEKFFDM